MTSLVIYYAKRHQTVIFTPLFGLAWSVDRQAANRGLIPAWYMRLRTLLTVGAVTSLGTMLLA
jgi:hypothetical protein